MKASRLPERPPGFAYKAGLLCRPELFAEDVAVSRLAKKYGTPLYVYSETAIRQRYQSFGFAFTGQEHTICYSVKANSNLSVLKLLAGLGSGFDVVSGGELQRVLAVDRRAAKKVVFSGVGKQAAEIDLALRSGILLFNVESASEMRLLKERAVHLRKAASFAVRVNPDVDAQTHPYISTGLDEHKFGVPIEDSRELYRLGAANKYLKPVGVSTHIGSQIIDLSPFRESMEKVAELVVALRGDGYNVRYVDAGGGLGIDYRSEGSPDIRSEVKSYAADISAPLRGLGIHLLLEPGRSIVGPSGILVSRVVYKKTNNRKLFFITDSAMNDLLRPALYDAYHAIVPVVAPKSRETITADIVGPICESSDFMARRREMPEIHEGDLLAVLDAGAYGMSLASNYNSRPRPAEVLVAGRGARLIRRRENVDDMLGPERM